MKEVKYRYMYRGYGVNVYVVAHDVLAVAVNGSDYRGSRVKSTFYIGAVAGENHKEEYKHVVDCGTKLDEQFAKIMFPNEFED